MKIRFDLTDEVTITNTTVKLTAWVNGVINGQDRPTLEASALELVKKLFPDAKWAFSNFTFQPDGFTFRVQASTRIDATENDQLDKRAAAISDTGKLTLQISNLDASIPLFQKREAESNLRVSLIEKAKLEATKLGGEVKSITFGEVGSQAYANNGRAMIASYAMESAVAKGGGADGVSLGHSEKILLSATLVVRTGEQKSQLNG
jgi:hypothetical protein